MLWHRGKAYSQDLRERVLALQLRFPVWSPASVEIEKEVE